MIPIGDVNKSYTRPWITYLLIIINFLVFLYEESLPYMELNSFIYHYGFIPQRFLHALNNGNILSAFVPVFSSMFLHGGWEHIIGNMLYFYIFGDNVEDRCGHLRFLAFYMLSGIGATAVHFLSDPHSPIPAVGASGAISGLLGAYVLLFPQAQIRTLVIYGFFLRLVLVPAFLYIGFWFLMQLLFAMLPTYMGIAYWAHIGGFLTGLILIKLLARRRRPTPIYQVYYHYV